MNSAAGAACSQAVWSSAGTKSEPGKRVLSLYALLVSWSSRRAARGTVDCRLEIHVDVKMLGVHRTGNTLGKSGLETQLT